MELVEWHISHLPCVLVFQVAVPATAFEGRLLLWHETPEQVSSLPQVVFLVYVLTLDEVLNEMSADPSFWGWLDSYPPELL